MPDKKVTRPKFSAPQPPIPLVPEDDDLVLENAIPAKLEDKPVIDSVIEKDTQPTPPSPPSPTPPPATTIRTVTKEEKPAPHITPIPPSLPPASPPPVIKKNITPPPANNNNSSSSSTFLKIITVFSLILAVSGWGLYLKDNHGLKLDLSSLSISPSTPIPTPTPLSQELTADPTPSLSPNQQISLEVLNGSGIAGKASTTAEALEKLGYTIVKTGNADNQNYAETKIYLSPEFLVYTSFFEDLTDFGPATKSGELKDSSASARIIIGKNWTK